MLEIINGLLSSAIFNVPIYVFGLLTLKEKENKQNTFIYNLVILLVSTILYAFIFVYLDGTLKTILLCTIFMLTFRFLFNISYGKSIIATIIYAIITIIPDLIVTMMFSNIVGKEYFYTNLSGGIISNILVSLITIVIIFLLKKPLRKCCSYNISTSKQIIIMSILTILFIAYFFYRFAKGYELNENIIIYLLAIFVFALILFALFKQKIENEAISKKYDDLLSIMKNYETDIEEQRTMIHETRNELMTIKSKINDKEKESAIISYIDSILGDKVSSKMSKFSKFKYLPSNGLRGFFYYKFNEAEERNIKVSVNISKKIENSFLSKLETKDFKDLVRMIGVYLDNAIEASSESKDKKLGIEIYLINKDIEIIISNTFNNNINKEKLGIDRFTTKGKNRGYGLLLVKHIIYSNRIFETKTEINNNLYIQRLKIKKLS